jgi:hypothetical protein
MPRGKYQKQPEALAVIGQPASVLGQERFDAVTAKIMACAALE